ncbi:TSUP family transporter [Nibribacter ruber]|uniref:Probable membrane transporter protein n=1 Tax=Nibribacter ruber TaxID=2698458 RepID=A0A6P1NX79_9BACT|nr:sulfite exporter TauE/SafE family protein [Nibribacter ruber]QHL86934.1 TSUP family transporter [Nibribacter ruber]
MEILGYAAALLIGISLGLTGSGGSILTVPILVYLIGLTPVTATAYSLFVVGSTSLVGSFKMYRKKLVSFKTALVFGIPSLLTVLFTRAFVIPAIPDTLFTVGAFTVTKDIMLMVLFAVLMVAASYSMIHKKKSKSPKETAAEIRYLPVMGQGMLVGLISGLVGAGGGFLIIPALVLFTGLEMKLAVGTSLFIIAANSLFGFLGDVLHSHIDWVFLLAFSSLSIAGIFIGTALSTRIDGERLKKGFGWFILAMGVYIIAKELFF